MTLPEFANIFAPLAIQLRQTDADEATIRAYFVGLKDLEIEFLAVAATRLARAAEWFPRVPEWRAAAAKVEAERRAEQRKLLQRLPTPLCVACGDSGWAADVTPSAPRTWLHPDGRVDEVPTRSSAPMRRCDCQKLRRLELLGRRPWPTLPAAPDVEAQDRPLTPGESAAASLDLKRRGFRMTLRDMPALSGADKAAIDDDL